MLQGQQRPLPAQTESWAGGSALVSRACESLSVSKRTTYSWIRSRSLQTIRGRGGFQRVLLAEAVSLTADVRGDRGFPSNLPPARRPGGYTADGKIWPAGLQRWRRDGCVRSLVHDSVGSDVSIMRARAV